VLLGALSVGALDASAYREPLVHEPQPQFEPTEEWLEVGGLPFGMEQEIEGACGLALAPPFGPLYVSDYYHHAVHRFSLGGTYGGTTVLPGGDSQIAPIKQSNSVCGLAVDTAGNLYANYFHQQVVRLSPSEAVIDPGYATGIAVDEAGDLYVNHRTYVSVYDAPVEPGEEPAEKIGEGSLGDAYGVAVDSKTGRVYVPDAADETVKVYKPAVKLEDPVSTIDGPSGSGFNSLVDASLAVDSSEFKKEEAEGEGHLLVVDNLKPEYERPQAAVYEFDSSGKFLDRLQTRTVGPPGVKKEDGPIFGEPSGIVVDPKSGDVFVTTGNSEEANVLAYGPYLASAPPARSGSPSASGASFGGASSWSQSAERSAPAADGGGGQPALASEVTQRGKLRVTFSGQISPHALPRNGTAPVSASVGGRVSTTDGSNPPQLRRFSIAINRHAYFDYTGLPVCHLANIDPSTSAGALEACHSSLVGEGSFSANVKIPEQSPFPSEGKVLAFNGLLHGQPVILAHVFGTKPVPTSYVLPFSIKGSQGTYGTILEASLPQVTGEWGYVTGMSMTLNRRFTYRGHKHSYMSAGCPAPAGFPGAVFPFTRSSFSFAGGPKLTSTLVRSCKVSR
jgi:DNA-binding beta-propeller fold protein YncE